MKISVTYGRRAADRVELEISDITDAVEIYNKAGEIVKSNKEAALIVECVLVGNYSIVPSPAES